MTRSWAGGAAIAACLLACSCDPAAPLTGAGDAGADAGDAGAGDDAGAALRGEGEGEGDARIAAIVEAEHKRLAELVLPSDLQSRDPRVRRAAARALARIGGDASAPGLSRALSDEDEDVVAWAAYGLGYGCKGKEAPTVSALVARALAWTGRGEPPEAKPGDPAAASPRPADEGRRRLDAFAAIARAVGRCGAETSEPTLTAWLAGPRDRAVAAAFGLGDLGMQKKRLREETLVALLGVAAGSASAPPVQEALFAVGRLENVPASVTARVRQVATARLAEPGPGRLLAVRALSRGGEEAAGELGRVLASPGMFTAAERAEAARGLKRLGVAGQRALEQAIPSLVPSADPVALTGLVGDDFGALLTALDVMDAKGGARKGLRELAALPPPPSAPPSIARRVSWLRCSAAKLVVGSSYTDPLLAGCDVTSPEARSAASIGARAAVEVIGRAAIEGPRLAAWRAFATGTDVRAREAALELITSHEEIEGAAEVLALALKAKEPGVVATAAEVIAKQPQRAGAPAASGKGKRGKKRREKKAEEGEPVAAPPPSPDVVKALVAALSPAGGSAELESLDTVIDAVGALAVKEALPRLTELCRSPYPTTREHAEKAIGLVASGAKPVCGAPPQGGEAPAELASLARGPVTLDFDTEAGAVSVTLDPELAPVTVTRIVELARAGYYRGMVVHRVAHGFVTQLGAPFGDGFGGPPGKPPLRCETSPLPFEPLSVGMALSGRDTGSSQIFVMHARSPHLDGGYALIGTASGPWAAFVDGDIVREVKVRP